MRTLRTLTLLFAALCGTGLLADPASGQMTDPDQERARQLVLRIRRSMREIDSLLLTGSQPAKEDENPPKPDEGKDVPEGDGPKQDGKEKEGGR